jgi:hypothetical protein
MGKETETQRAKYISAMTTLPFPTYDSALYSSIRASTHFFI